MLKNKILIYISDKYFYIYFPSQKKEIIEKIDNEFMLNGEIKSVEKGLKYLNDIDKKYNIFFGFFKPFLIVLYNDITSSDIKYLYKHLLERFSYGKIDFIPISRLLRNDSNYNNLVLFDSCYTYFKKRKKYFNCKEIDNPILIGNDKSKKLHYSDKNYIWNKFINDFTNN